MFSCVNVVPSVAHSAVVYARNHTPLGLRAERHSARISKITNDGLTRSCTGCFTVVTMWQQWASKG